MPKETPKIKLQNPDVVLTVKCTCGETKDLRPGDVADDDIPMCDKCFMPMMPYSAGVKAK